MDSRCLRIRRRVRAALGSFELTFEDGEWGIALWYLDTLEQWEAEQTDPLTSSFCEAGLYPWS
jgi:hypothetical protein